MNYASKCLASVHPSHQFRENEVPRSASRQQASQCRQRWNSLKSDFSHPELSSGPNVDESRKVAAGPGWQGRGLGDHALFWQQVCVPHMQAGLDHPQFSLFSFSFLFLFLFLN